MKKSISKNLMADLTLPKRESNLVYGENILYKIQHIETRWTITEESIKEVKDTIRESTIFTWNPRRKRERKSEAETI